HRYGNLTRAVGGTIRVPLVPPDAAGIKVPVPPDARICPSWALAGQLPGLSTGGFSTTGPGSGAAVPRTLSTVGGLSNKRPAASVIANVAPVKHPPVGLTRKLTPLVNTGNPVSVSAGGKLVCTVEGGVPP